MNLYVSSSLPPLRPKLATAATGHQEPAPKDWTLSVVVVIVVAIFLRCYDGYYYMIIIGIRTT